MARNREEEIELWAAAYVAGRRIFPDVIRGPRDMPKVEVHSRDQWPYREDGHYSARTETIRIKDWSDEVPGHNPRVMGHELTHHVQKKRTFGGVLVYELLYRWEARRGWHQNRYEEEAEEQALKVNILIENALIRIRVAKVPIPEVPAIPDPWQLLSKYKARRRDRDLERKLFYALFVVARRAWPETIISVRDMPSLLIAAPEQWEESGGAYYLSESQTIITTDWAKWGVEEPLFRTAWAVLHEMVHHVQTRRGVIPRQYEAAGALGWEANPYEIEADRVSRTLVPLMLRALFLLVEAPKPVYANELIGRMELARTTQQLDTILAEALAYYKVGLLREPGMADFQAYDAVYTAYLSRYQALIRVIPPAPPAPPPPPLPYLSPPEIESRARWIGWAYNLSTLEMVRDEFEFIYGLGRMREEDYLYLYQLYVGRYNILARGGPTPPIPVPERGPVLPVAPPPRVPVPPPVAVVPPPPPVPPGPPPEVPPAPPPAEVGMAVARAVAGARAVRARIRERL